MKQRLDYIDVMKGFAILLVTMGHVFLQYTEESQSHPVAQMIYSCHMSFFFFLSGFLLYKTHCLTTKGLKPFIIKKLQTLILPWISFTLFVPLILNRGYEYEVDYSKFNPYPVNGYWFLPILFCFMMLWLVGKIISKRIKERARYMELLINAFIIFALLGIGFFYHLYHFIIWAIYYAVFFFGYVLSGSDTIERLLLKKWVYGASALVLIISWKLGPIDTLGGIPWRSLINLCWNAVCSITACVCFFNLFLFIQMPTIVKTYLQKTGKLSLCIYLIPVTVLPSDFVFPEWMSLSLINILILIISLLVNYIRYSIGFVIFEIPVLRFILFGKK